jgi:hypothetical protein
MNRLLKHQGLSFNAMLPPPPIFPDFPEYTTSEDEGEKDTGIHWLEEMCLLPNLKKKKTLSH